MTTPALYDVKLRQFAEKWRADRAELKALPPEQMEHAIREHYQTRFDRIARSLQELAALQDRSPERATWAAAQKAALTEIETSMRGRLERELSAL